MFSNHDRSNAVDELLREYAVAAGLSGESSEAIAADMIASVLMWIQLRPGPDGRSAALDAAHKGVGLYVSHSYVAFDGRRALTAPPARVQIEVRCRNDVWRAATHHQSHIELGAKE